MLCMYIQSQAKSSISMITQEKEKEPKTLSIHQPMTTMRYKRVSTNPEKNAESHPSYTTMPHKIRSKKKDDKLTTYSPAPRPPAL